MNKVAPPSDISPRRLKFSKPDPAESQREQQIASRDKRKAKPEKFKLRPTKRDRLPNGAHFDVTYDAADATWSGWLEVGPVRVEAKAGGVMTLLAVLDQKFRADPRAPKAEPIG